MSKGFSRFGFIKKMISPTVAHTEDIGGKMQETIISPKGLYSKPVNTDTITMPLMRGETQNTHMPMQDFIEDLEDGDVRLTDGKSEVDLNYNGGVLKLSGKILANIVSETIGINGKKQMVIDAPILALSADDVVEMFSKAIKMQGLKIDIESANEINLKAPKITLTGDSCQCNGEDI